MGLIDDDGVVLAERGVRLGLGQQDAIGHELHARLRTRLVGEPDLAPDLTAPFAIEFLGQPPRQREGRDPPGLRTADLGPHPHASLEAHLWKLGGLARAGFARNDHHLMGLDRRHDLGAPRGDRQRGRIAQWGDQRLLTLAKRDRIPGLGEQPSERGHRCLRMGALPAPVQ